MLDRRVLREVQHERGFPHRRARGNDDELGRLKPDVMSSRSAKPLGTPVMFLPPFESASMRSIVGQSSSLIRVKSTPIRGPG